jgi:hypothetical protein
MIDVLAEWAEWLNSGIRMHDRLKAVMVQGSFSIHPMSILFNRRNVFMCDLSF